MPQTNAIINGTFDQGSTGWTGVDLETNFNETAYLQNGSTNRVSEIDGGRNQITVMQQNITVSSSHTTTLDFRMALRNTAQSLAGQEGFRVDVLDSNGVVIAQQTYLPTSNSWVNVSLPVTFPAAGTYTVRFTEIGAANNSVGAIVDDISLLVCFAAQTRIDTDKGPVAAGDLIVGDRVWTADGGFQPIRWIGARHVSAQDQRLDPTLRPVVFRPGALGQGVPSRRLVVSPQHRILHQDWRAAVLFGTDEVLVPAVSLMRAGAVHRGRGGQDVTYVHFLLDAHHIVRAEGVLTESFLPTTLSLRGLDPAARAELTKLFPDLLRPERVSVPMVRPGLQMREALLVA